MDKLHEIVRVVGRKRLKRIEVFNDFGGSKKDNLYYRFYRGVKDGTFQSDEDAAKALFETDPSDKKYLMLKSRVKARLLNTLFFLDNTSSRYEQAVYKCNRNLMTAKFLLLNGARATAESMLRTTLHESDKFELTEISLNCLLSLRYGASITGNITDFDYYRKRFSEVEALFQAECKAEEYYQVITIPFSRSNSNRPELAAQAMEYVEEIENVRKEHSSFRLEMALFRLKTMAGQICGDHEYVLKACDENEAYISKKTNMTLKIRFGEIALYRIVAFLHLGRYEDGKKIASKSVQYFGEGSANWMIFHENYFLLCMHTGNYQMAADIYQQVTEHPRFEKIDDTRKEKWRIFEAFLRYMLNGNIDIEAGAIAESQFKIMKFLNEVPIYSKDKRGLNIAIIILQVLFLLDRGDFDGIISKAEALRVYCSRYLRQDENYRSNCFLKTVLLMEKKDFDYERTAKNAERYFHKLNSSRFDYQNGNLASLEIIPYEKLWKTILGKLHNINQ